MERCTCTQGQTNTRGRGYNSFFCYTKRASVRGRSDCQRAEGLSEGGGIVRGQRDCQRAERLSRHVYYTIKYMYNSI